jgi:hypothetical protein
MCTANWDVKVSQSLTDPMMSWAMGRLVLNGVGSFEWAGQPVVIVWSGTTLELSKHTAVWVKSPGCSLDSFFDIMENHSWQFDTAGVGTGGGGWRGSRGRQTWVRLMGRFEHTGRVLLCSSYRWRNWGEVTWPRHSGLDWNLGVGVSQTQTVYSVLHGLLTRAERRDGGGGGLEGSQVAECEKPGL